MFSSNLDNFEIINSGNNKLFEAIQYIEKNIDTPIFNKIKSSGIFPFDITNKLQLLPYIMETGLDSFTLLFRQTNTSNNVLTDIWVSRVTSIAKDKLLQLELFENSYQLQHRDLINFVKLSNNDTNLKLLSEYLFNHYNILLIYVNNITGMKTDAVTFKLESGHYVIGMSLRINQYDSFWFTLMHELSHIYLHSEILVKPHFDYFDKNNLHLEDIEIEANVSAKDLLIPKKIWLNCKARRTLSEKDIKDFSNEYNIHPSIIAGFIRFEKNNYSIFNNIIRTIDIKAKLLE